MTDTEVAAGVAALKAYVEQIDGWEADFVSDSTYQQGAIEVIQEWDKENPTNEQDDPAAAATLIANCGLILFQQISAAGYGDKVTADQCATAAQAVMTAVQALRLPPPTPTTGA